MFFGAHSIIFETLFVFAGKITFRFSPRALFDLPDLYFPAFFLIGRNFPARPFACPLFFK